MVTRWALGKTALKRMKTKSCGILKLTFMTNICEFGYPFARTEIDCANFFLFPIHNSQLKNLHVFVGSCPFVVGFCHSEGAVNTKLHPSGLVYIISFQQLLYVSLFQCCNQQHANSQPFNSLAASTLQWTDCKVFVSVKLCALVGRVINFKQEY